MQEFGFVNNYAATGRQPKKQAWGLKTGDEPLICGNLGNIFVDLGPFFADN
jgi:hypothetical protein